MKERDRSPSSEFARYAYGYSDKKPGWTYWLIQGIMVIGAVTALFGVWGR